MKLDPRFEFTPIGGGVRVSEHFTLPPTIHLCQLTVKVSEQMVSSKSNRAFEI